MGLSDFVNSIITRDKFSATFGKFDKGVEKSARGLDKLGGVMSSGSLAMLFGGTAGVAGAVGIAKTVWSLGELGAQSLDTERSFSTLMQSVGQSPALLNQMKAAAGGTVTELQLMQAANTALAGTQGQLSTELAGAIPKLIEAGRAAAMLNPAMGDAAFMTQSLISGIKRGSPMLIDNTGITLKLGEATQAYADSVGKSVTELTAQERSIAILRATLSGADTLIQQTGGSLDSMTGDMQRAQVAAQEAKTAFAEMIAPAVAEGATNLALGIRGITASLTNNKMDQLAVDIEYYTKQLKDYESQTPRTTAGQNRLNKSIEQAQGRLSELRVEMQALEAPAQNAKRLISEYSDAADDATVSTAALSNVTDRFRMHMIAGSSAAATWVSQIKDIKNAANDTVTNFTGYLGGADVLSQSQYIYLTQDRIDLENELTEAVRKGTISQQEADFQLARYDGRVQNHISSLRDQGKAVSSVASSYDDLKSKIGQQLTPTFDLSGLTGGLLGGQMGDTWDEAYKRLAAVALRPGEELAKHSQDWADTFAAAGLEGLSPEDAQAKAKAKLDEFAQGIFDPALIDFEKIKNNVRQAMRAQKLFDDIVSEIAQEMGFEKENKKLEEAGTSIGKQVGKAYLAEIQRAGSQSKLVVAAAVAPEVAAILKQQDQRYNQ